MPKIEVVTNALREKAVTIGKDTKSIAESQQSVMSIFQDLGTVFSGTLPTVMVEYMLSMDESYRSINAEIEGYKTYLNSTADTYDWTEKQLRQWARALGGEKAAAIYREGGITPPPPGWDDLGQDFPNDPPNLNSYSGKSTNTNSKTFPPKSEYNGDSVTHINCVHYARARAMEVNGLNECPSFPPGENSTVIRENSVAWYHKSGGGVHAVYVEQVKYDENGNPTWVVFSDSNMKGQADGTVHSMSYEDFQTYQGREGWQVANYDYF